MLRRFQAWSRGVVITLCCGLFVALPLPARSQAGYTAQQAQLRINELINKVREQHGDAPLHEQPALVRAALGHSKEMLRLHYFAHESPTPGLKTMMDRVQAQGVYPASLGENIFRCHGYPLSKIPEIALKAWMASPGHRENILDPGFSGTGIGVAYNGYNCFITQDFTGH